MWRMRNSAAARKLRRELGAELGIESFYPADAETAEALRAMRG